MAIPRSTISAAMAWGILMFTAFVVVSIILTIHAFQHKLICSEKPVAERSPSSTPRGKKERPLCCLSGNFPLLISIYLGIVLFALLFITTCLALTLTLPSINFSLQHLPVPILPTLTIIVYFVIASLELLFAVTRYQNALSLKEILRTSRWEDTLVKFAFLFVPFCLLWALSVACIRLFPVYVVLAASRMILELLMSRQFFKLIHDVFHDTLISAFNHETYEKEIGPIRLNYRLTSIGSVISAFGTCLLFYFAPGGAVEFYLIVTLFMITNAIILFSLFQRNRMAFDFYQCFCTKERPMIDVVVSSTAPRPTARTISVSLEHPPTLSPTGETRTSDFIESPSNRISDKFELVPPDTPMTPNDSDTTPNQNSVFNFPTVSDKDSIPEPIRFQHRPHSLPSSRDLDEIADNQPWQQNSTEDPISVIQRKLSKRNITPTIEMTNSLKKGKHSCGHRPIPSDGSSQSHGRALTDPTALMERLNQQTTFVFMEFLSSNGLLLDHYDALRPFDFGNRDRTI